MPQNKKLLGGWLAAILAILAGGGTIAIVATPDNEQVAPAIVTVPIDATGDGEADRTLTAPAAAAEQVRDNELGDHADLRDETPDGVPDALIDDAVEQQEDLAARDDLPLISPLAAPSQPGCDSRFVRNHSSRRGVRPRLWVVHFTVSANRPGLSDMNAVTSLGNNPGAAVSWTYLIDREAHCYYSVREIDKPWTQGTFNPVSISAEIINSGRERNLIDGAGLDKLARVISDSAKRWDIPLSKGAVNGCTVTRAGIVDHRTLGQCGGGHVDVTQHYPGALDQVIAAARAHRERTTCNTSCRRARDLRKRNTATHAELRRRHCAPINQTRSDRCRFLHRRHTAIHAAAKRENVKL